MLKADIRTAYAVWIDLVNAAEIKDPNGVPFQASTDESNRLTRLDSTYQFRLGTPGDVVELEVMNSTQMGTRMGKKDGIESVKWRFDGDLKPCYQGIKLNSKGSKLVEYADL